MNMSMKPSGTWKKRGRQIGDHPVELHPKIKFSGDKQPTAEELGEMHHFAPHECFIANSVKTECDSRSEFLSAEEGQLGK